HNSSSSSGYFLELGCSRSAAKFLDESPHLREFAAGLRMGRRYSCRIDNLSMLQMLNAEMFATEPMSDISQDATRLQLNTSCSHRSDSPASTATLIDYLNRDFVHKVADSVTKVLDKSIEEKLNWCLQSPSTKTSDRESGAQLLSTPK